MRINKAIQKLADDCAREGGINYDKVNETDKG